MTVSVNAANLPEGSYVGRVTIAALPGIPVSNSPQVLEVELSIGVPVINAGGVVNSASFNSDAVNSPGAITSLFGRNLASGTQASTELPLPLTLSGTQVLVGGTPAPLFFVSPGQINFQMPATPVGAGGTTVPVVVVSDGHQSLPSSVALAPASPGIFTVDASGRGAAVVLNADMSLNSSLNPATRGGLIAIYVTGLGETNPFLAAGLPAQGDPLNRTVAVPTVLVGGIEAELFYSGGAPGFAGLYQINARVPANVAAGSVPLEVRAAGRSSNTVTIAVK
jgi:uncharacterized protein (TIGR03437 family)